ncbi:MAG: ATP-dependent helicase [Patescibacteria group bacterium]|nr:ATP-dependent helicase [Patescibacteria group bacterium]MCL5432434.1 ATP-dependent helicase [Patescibacteria group bacterium]
MANEKKILNPQQQKAVEHKDGPLLIVAGAGTGKTTVVTERIKWLIGKDLAKPEEILALTFTEKAAREMEERVDQTLPYGTFGMWILTFHSFCDRILRAEALHIGLSPHYKLLTEAETYLLVKKNFWKFELDHFRPSGNPYKFIEGMIQHFSRLKDEDINPEQYKNDEYLELVGAYQAYEKLKVDEGVMDFADLISNTLKLFRRCPEILARYQKQFKYVLVDEFQDTNFAQNELVKLLCGQAQNVTVVADDDQSIYRFRGAAVANVLQFKKDFPDAKVITLTTNYRSTQEILDRAYDLIQHNNPDRLEVAEKIDKKLVSGIGPAPVGPGNKGDKIEVIYTDRVEEEAEAVVKKIKGPNFSDYAILVRANNHSEPFVRALERARIPYQFLGPGQLFRQSEVKDLVAYLKVLYDFTDSVSLYRVLSMDIFGFSQRDLIWILNKAKRINLCLFEQLEKEENEKIKEFVAMVHRHQELIPKESAGQILYYFLEDSGILKSIVNWEIRAAQNIAKFFDKLKSFESTNKDAGVFATVDYLDLAMDMGESPLAAETDWSGNNAVNILTIHSAKGLEFPVVFLVNLVEGRFPTRERSEQVPIPDKLIKEVLPKGDFHIEEERRLFYVGMTRAKEKLIFCAANFYGEGKRERKLSPFVHEALGSSDQVLVTSKEKEQLPLFEWTKPVLEPPARPGRASHQNLEPYHVDYLSYSAIQAFKECPLHYKLRYILRIPTPTTAPLSMGNSIHLALRDLYREPGANLLELLERNWEPAGYTSKKHEVQTKEKAKKFLTEYLKSEIHKTAKPLLLEQPFSFKIEDLKIGGKIDRVDDRGDGVVEIIDYKTGANVPTQKDIDADLQMTIYALAMADRYLVNKIKLSFYYFDTQSQVTTIRTKEQLEEAKKELLRIRDEIEKSDFLCSGSMMCKNCEFKILCNG